MCGRVAKGGRVETEGGVPHGVWLRRRHRGAQAYLRGRLRRHQPGRRERLTHFRESGQRQVERSCVEFYRTRVLQISYISPTYHILSPKCHPFTCSYRPLQCVYKRSYHQRITRMSPRSRTRNGRRREKTREAPSDPPRATRAAGGVLRLSPRRRAHPSHTERRDTPTS